MTRRIPAHRLLWLVAPLAVLALPDHAPAQVYYNASRTNSSLYEATDSNMYYVSDIDRQRALERDRKYAEREASKERDRQKEAERKARVIANRPKYDPKPVQEQHIQMSGQQQGLTVEKMVDSMVASQAATAASTTKAPPALKGYMTVTVDDEFYYYADGVFYISMGDDLAEVPAPPGALVFKIPKEFQVADLNGTRYYIVKKNWFQRVMINGTPAFKVVAEQILTTEPQYIGQTPAPES